MQNEPSEQIHVAADQPSHGKYTPVIVGLMVIAVVAAGLMIHVINGWRNANDSKQAAVNSRVSASKTSVAQKTTVLPSKAAPLTAPVAAPLPSDDQVLNPADASSNPDTSSQTISQGSVDFAVRDADNALSADGSSLNATE